MHLQARKPSIATRKTQTRDRETLHRPVQWRVCARIKLKIREISDERFLNREIANLLLCRPVPVPATGL